MPVTSPTATLSAHRAEKYVGNAMLWRALVRQYPEILKPIWVVHTGNRTQRTYLVKSIDQALDQALREGQFARPEHTAGEDRMRNT